VTTGTVTATGGGTASDPAQAGGGGPAAPAAPAAPPAADAMKAEIDRLNREIAEGDAAKARLQVLKPLFDKKEKARKDYEAARPGLLDQWQRQRCEVLHVIKQVAAEQPHWIDVVAADICPTLQAIDAKTKQVAALAVEGVLLQPTSDLADTKIKAAQREVTAADKLQQAWLDVTNTLKGRLNDFDKRLGVLKASGAPLSHPSNLYVLFYDLLPDLLALAPADAPDDVKELAQVRAKLPCPAPDKAPPQLVTVQGLSAAQDGAWQDYTDAQAALAAAKAAAHDKVAELEAAQAELKNLVASLTAKPAAAAAAPAANAA
ncbi:MAG: hypothetical protein JWQ29_3347, partial [Phenylobacterium sp.]|nr:hypothetical protein [Phenylobacterium sp.]